MKNRTHIYLLFIAIILPSIINLMSRYFIGYMSYDSIVLYQSYETLEVLIEIFQEFMPLVIMGIVGTMLYKINKDEVGEYISGALILQVIVILPFIIFMIFNMSNFIDFNNTPDSVKDSASTYYILNLLTMIPSVIYLILYNSLISINKPIIAVFSSISILVVNYITQLALISTSDFSMQLGLIGVPISTGIAYIINIIILTVILISLGYKFKLPDFSKLKELISLGKYTILESFIRNIGYIFGTTLIINSLGAEVMGIHNSVSEIYWSLYLLPVMAYGVYIKINLSHEESAQNQISLFNFIKKNTIVMTLYFLFLLLINYIWGENIFFWLNSNNHQIVTNSSFVTIFLFNTVNFYLFGLITIVTSYAQGKVKFNIVAAASFVINILYFIPIGLLNQYTSVSVNYGEFIIITLIGYIINFLVLLILIMKNEKVTML